MMSVTRSSVLALLCWVMVAQSGATNDSDAILDFVSLWNGVFDDVGQVKHDNQKRDTIIVRYIPVKLTTLGGPAFYMDESVNGVFYRQQLRAVTEIVNKLMYLISFNFTDSGRPNPANLKPDDLDNLTVNDLNPADPTCKSPFERLEPGVYSGNKPDCRITENGQHPAYAATFTCDGISATSPRAAKEVTTWAPYILTRRGDRFPTKNLPPNYVGPCDKKQ